MVGAAAGSRDDVIDRHVAEREQDEAARAVALLLAVAGSQVTLPGHGSTLWTEVLRGRDYRRNPRVPIRQPWRHQPRLLIGLAPWSKPYVAGSTR